MHKVNNSHHQIPHYTIHSPLILIVNLHLAHSRLIPTTLISLYTIHSRSIDIIRVTNNAVHSRQISVIYNFYSPLRCLLEVPECELPDRFCSFFEKKIASIGSELELQPADDTPSPHSFKPVSQEFVRNSAPQSCVLDPDHFVESVLS